VHRFSCQCYPYLAAEYDAGFKGGSLLGDIITTVDGDGSKGFSGDGGQATSATLSYPSGVAVDVPGNIYIADTWNHRIRMVTKSTDIITTVAGVGESRSYGTSNFSGIELPIWCRNRCTRLYLDC
jgi:NHL repeat